MKFSVIKNGNNPIRDKIAEELIETCLLHGLEYSTNIDEVKFILNLADADSPKAIRRRSQSIFVITLVADGKHIDDLKSYCYSSLVKTFSNLFICAVPENGNSLKENIEMYFTTPEMGFYHIPFDSENVFERIIPIAGARFANDNVFQTDLPEKFWNSSTIIENIKHYGSVLNNLGVLPVPFPLKDLLSEEDLRYLYKIFGITGASYGNLSARENIPELGKTTFWMTGRGVNKANLSKVGKDLLLVKDFDYEKSCAIVSVPPDYDVKARVSVDAVEHHLIYSTFRDVGAIVHVHAWVDGILSTRQNYPCGTIELAREVVELIKQTENPSQAVVGLRNHGLTITGINLDDIFNRISGKLLPEVPMF